MKNHSDYNTRIVVTGAMLLAGFSLAKGAVLISKDSSKNAYIASSTAILQGNTPVNNGSGSLGSIFFNGFSTDNPAMLTDGIYGSANPNQDIGSTLSVRNNAILDFTLAMTGAGFDLQSGQVVCFASGNSC